MCCCVWVGPIGGLVGLVDTCGFGLPIPPHIHMHIYTQTQTGSPRPRRFPFPPPRPKRPRPHRVGGAAVYAPGFPALAGQELAAGAGASCGQCWCVCVCVYLLCVCMCVCMCVKNGINDRQIHMETKSRPSGLGALPSLAGTYS